RVARDGAHRGRAGGEDHHRSRAVGDDRLRRVDRHPTGIGLVSKDIENGAIANVLSKPVRRSEVILGKYLGLCLTLFLSSAATAAAIAVALIYAQGGVAAVQLRLWPAAWLIFLELAIITAVTLLFSCFSSPALSALFALLIFLIGRWSPDLKLLA